MTAKLEEEKRYLLSELSLEKETHARTIELYEAEKRKGSLGAARRRCAPTHARARAIAAGASQWPS